MAPDVDRDLKSLANVYDPFPLYRWLRDHEPVHWSSSLNAWAATRYADVLEVFSRPTAFSSDRFHKIGAKYASQRPAVRAVGEILADWLVFRDPPDHTRLRSLLQKSFPPPTSLPAGPVFKRRSTSSRSGRRPVSTFDAGVFPRQWAVSPDGRLLYLTEFGSDALAIFRASSIVNEDASTLGLNRPVQDRPQEEAQRRVVFGDKS